MVTPYLAEVYGGTTTSFLALAEAIAQTHVSLDLITTNANGATCLDVATQTWIEQSGYRVQYFTGWHRHDQVWSHALLGWLHRHLQDYDVVHTHTLFSPFMAAVHGICGWRRIPYVMTPHGMLDAWALAQKAWKKQLYYTLVERACLRHAAKIHVLNASEAKQAIALGFSHTVTIPNGIRASDVENLPSAEWFLQEWPHLRHKTLILFLSRLHPKKGLDLLAPAFAQIHHQFPQTHLVIAGPDQDGFQAIAEGYFDAAGCRAAVTFTGMLSGLLKYGAIAASSLYVLPSYSEGLSMSVLEAMGAGLPCVITTGCHFPEAAQQQAVIEIPPSVRALTDALMHLLIHPDQAWEMGDRARRFVLENYTWQQSAQTLVDVYGQIVSVSQE
jgi:glycosyltransferase involved in cell wall biosynthesis